MPTEFQKAMDCTLQGLDGVICYLEDILVVTKRDVEDHKALVEVVMKSSVSMSFRLINQLGWDTKSMRKFTL